MCSVDFASNKCSYFWSFFLPPFLLRYKKIIPLSQPIMLEDIKNLYPLPFSTRGSLPSSQQVEFLWWTRVQQVTLNWIYSAHTPYHLRAHKVGIERCVRSLMSLGPATAVTTAATEEECTPYWIHFKYLIALCSRGSECSTYCTEFEGENDGVHVLQEDNTSESINLDKFSLLGVLESIEFIRKSVAVWLRWIMWCQSCSFRVPTRFWFTLAGIGAISVSEGG